MNLILTRLVHNFDFHMLHNPDIGTNITRCIFNSEKDVFRWWEIEIRNIINGDKQWILCTWIADTPNANLHNIQCIHYQTALDLAVAPISLLEIQEVAVAVIIHTEVAGRRTAAAAAAMFKSPVLVAVGLTAIEMSNSGTNLGVIMAVAWAHNDSKQVIAMTMMINCDPQGEDPA